MTKADEIWSTTAVAEAGVASGSPLADVVQNRADILRMTQTAEDAVLKPKEPGAWSLPMRAAFATRIAKLNGADKLAVYYSNLIDISQHAAIAETDLADDPKPIIAFLDAVATRPRDFKAEDIKILQDADIADADIVRLTELVAFVSYQIRLVAGLSLLAKASA